jgi:hypothetical protein
LRVDVHLLPSFFRLPRPKGVPGAKRSGIRIPSVRLTVDVEQAIKPSIGD